MILQIRLQEISKLFDYVIIDVQPTRSQICLTAVGAANWVLIPAESATKGVNSLLDTQKFLAEQASVMAFKGQILGIVPFRDRWVGRTQTLESRDNIAAMKEFADRTPVLPTIRESEKFEQGLSQRISRKCQSEEISREVFIEALFVYFENHKSIQSKVLTEARKRDKQRQKIANYRRAKSMIERFGSE